MHTKRPKIVKIYNSEKRKETVRSKKKSLDEATKKKLLDSYVTNDPGATFPLNRIPSGVMVDAEKEMYNYTQSQSQPDIVPEEPVTPKIKEEDAKVELPATSLKRAGACFFKEESLQEIIKVKKRHRENEEHKISGPSVT